MKIRRYQIKSEIILIEETKKQESSLDAICSLFREEFLQSTTHKKIWKYYRYIR